MDFKPNEKSTFFPVFALTSPHTPIVPIKKWRGKSGAGAYGDYMMQSDWTVGEILKALKRYGFEDNTIVIFTSDNGPECYA
jgi:arylsulfatase A-like enzyme